MEAILTVLLFFLLFIWLLGRLIPRLLAWYLRQKTGVGHIDGNKRGRWHRENNEGEIEIEYSEAHEKIITKDMGEYIEFEEKRKDKS